MSKDNLIDLAEVVLRSSFLQREDFKGQYSAHIKDLILGSHKTYRYILVTNLLARATSDLVNPIALQANADVVGAFDSRSSGSQFSFFSL
jgi:hypothetical protein